MFITKIPSVMGWPFTIVYFALWLIALYFTFFSIPKALKTNHWLATTGNVTDNKLVKTERTNSRTHKRITVYSAKVHYTYTVDGQVYKGVEQKMAKRAQSGEKIHQTLLAHYPIGSDLIVYYDPENTQRTVLKQGITSLHIVLGGLLLLSIAWFTLLIFEALKR